MTLPFFLLNLYRQFLLHVLEHNLKTFERLVLKDRFAFTTVAELRLPDLEVVSSLSHNALVSEEHDEQAG